MGSKKRKTASRYLTRWAIKALSIDEQGALQAALDEGFEPFAMITRFEEDKKSLIAAAGKPAGIVPVNLMFLKVAYRIPLDEQGRPMTRTVYKRSSKEPENVIPIEPEAPKSVVAPVEPEKETDVAK
jgi:hypothetical protein